MSKRKPRLQSTIQDSRAFIGIVNDKGRVTIPITVRRLLQLKPQSTVQFHVAGDSVHIVPQPMSLEDTFGSVKAVHKPENFSKMIREAKADHYSRRVHKKHS